MLLPMVKKHPKKVFSQDFSGEAMDNTDFIGLYLCSFVFGVIIAVFYDLLWVLRVSFLGKRFVWVADVLTVSMAGFMISLAQYNFSSGKFRVLPYFFLPIGVLCVRLTFSRVLRLIVQKIINTIHDVMYNVKIWIKSFIYERYILFSFQKDLV